MRILKVKVTKNNKIMMVWEEPTKQGTYDEYQMTCSDEARPEFYVKLQALGVHALEMLELPENYLDRIKVKGVSFSYGGDMEVMGATIITQMELLNSNQDLNLNTPHKASAPYSEGPADEKQLLTGDCVEALLELIEECKAYVSGDRAQGKLALVS